MMQTCECGWQSDSGKQHLCHCGCGNPIIQKYTWYTPRFINGHQSRGTNNSMYGRRGKNNPKWKQYFGFSRIQNMSEILSKIDISIIHEYIRRLIPEPSTCGRCGKILSGRYGYDLSNKDHKYSPTNLDAWWYLCRQCHKQYDFDNGLCEAHIPSPDGIEKLRLANLGHEVTENTRKKIRDTRKRLGIGMGKDNANYGHYRIEEGRKCNACGSCDTTMDEKWSRPRWYHLPDDRLNWYCHKCYMKDANRRHLSIFTIRVGRLVCKVIQSKLVRNCI